MTWTMSQFRRGDLVEVRSADEVLQTLDGRGCLEEMPFMPEMLQYCGRRFRVGMVAHKTCEIARQTLTARRLNAAVHLEGLRCDGGAHGGCEAACNLFWKDAWLKPVEDAGTTPQPGAPIEPQLARGMDAGNRLFKNTRIAGETDGDEVRYSCQATCLYDASSPVTWWDLRQYIRDVTSGNRSVSDVVRASVLSLLTHILRRTPIGYRLIKALRERFHRWSMGRDVPDFEGAIAPNERTPEGRLDLKPGEYVRIKPKEEIEKTLNKKRKNRGMYFDVEMTPYCGQVARVRGSVKQLINEATGQMIKMQQPCIILDDVVCRGEYSECRLMCPRALYPFWRELWLERVAPPLSTDGEG